MEMREPSDILNPQEPDKTLNEATENPIADEKPETEQAVANDSDAISSSEPVTKDSLLASAKNILEKDGSEIRRDEVSRIRRQFSEIKAAELAEAKAAHDKEQEGAENSSEFKPEADPIEDEFKEILNQIKDKKTAWTSEQETLRAANLDRKRAIIDEINTLAGDTDNVNRTYPRFQELRQEFFNIGEVAPTDETEIQKRFKEVQEHYYDQLKINKDLRDYDFRKNLDTKQLLIDEAQKLTEEPDIIVAFRRLQELHEKWRQTGPVAKDIRDEIWNKFKDFSTAINKRYQAHFEARKANEQANEQAKTAICERVEALDFAALKSFAAWDEMTKQILQAQEDWKKLGFASKKMNNALFARFRETCDKFFAAKAEYFKSTKDTLAQNLAKKIALCERAEALKDSTDWRKTTEELVELQKEWKTVGTVAKKHSDAVWHRFLEACDTFFDRKKKATSGTRQVEIANLKAKREVIDALNAIPADAPREEAIATVKELTAKWSSIGHVPFREKDKIYEAYRAKVTELQDRLDMREVRANLANFENSISEIADDENKLYRERERLLRSYEGKRTELQTIENNMGFFNSKSKAGDSMLREMQRKIQHIKEDIATLEKKIGVIDSKL
jgi:hypothetical protein